MIETKQTSTAHFIEGVRKLYESLAQLQAGGHRRGVDGTARP